MKEFQITRKPKFQIAEFILELIDDWR